MGHRTDPSGRIRVIILGDVIEPFENYNSFTVIDFAPAIETTLIPSVQENMVSVATVLPKAVNEAGKRVEFLLRTRSRRITATGSRCGAV